MSPADRLHPEEIAIFLFHGVVETSGDPVRNYHGKHLERAPFERMIAELARAGTPLSMDAALAALAAGTPLPPRAFAVTFDDGFENNASVAAPVLGAHGVPATFYVTTRFVEENGMSWIDRIEHYVAEAPPGSLRLPWSDGPRALADAGSRVGVLEEIRTRAKRDAGIDLEGLVETIRGQLGAEPVERRADPLDRKLSWRQVAALDAHPLFTVGGHTHTHPIMAHLAPDALAEEIDLCLELLRARAGVRTHHFSYPEGLAHCYSDAVIAALRARGIAACPTAIDGTNPPGTDPFHLRRINVGPEMS